MKIKKCKFAIEFSTMITDQFWDQGSTLHCYPYHQPTEHSTISLSLKKSHHVSRTVYVTQTPGLQPGI